jgi:hypothetical protein
LLESIKSVAALNSATCYADPFLPPVDDDVAEGSVLTRAMGWLAVPSGRKRNRPARPRQEPHLQSMASSTEG